MRPRPTVVSSKNGARALPAAMNIVVLARDGRYASATNRAGREFAVMTSEVTEPLIRRRIVVAGRWTRREAVRLPPGFPA